MTHEDLFAPVLDIGGLEAVEEEEEEKEDDDGEEFVHFLYLGGLEAIEEVEEKEEKNGGEEFAHLSAREDSFVSALDLGGLDAVEEEEEEEKEEKNCGEEFVHFAVRENAGKRNRRGEPCASCDSPVNPDEDQCDLCKAAEKSYFDQTMGDDLRNFQENRMLDAKTTFKETRKAVARQVMSESNARISKFATVTLDMIAHEHFVPCRRCTRRGKLLSCLHAKPAFFWTVWKMAAVCTLWRAITIEWVRSRKIVLVSKDKYRAEWNTFVAECHNRSDLDFLVERRPVNWPFSLLRTRTLPPHGALEKPLKVMSKRTKRPPRKKSLFIPKRRPNACLHASWNSSSSSESRSGAGSGSGSGSGSERVENSLF